MNGVIADWLFEHEEIVAARASQGVDIGKGEDRRIWRVGLDIVHNSRSANGAIGVDPALGDSKSCCAGLGGSSQHR